MVRCGYWVNPESPPVRALQAISPPPLAMFASLYCDVLPQAGGRGRTMMISQPAWICLETTWQRLTGRRIDDCAGQGAQEAPTVTESVPLAVTAMAAIADVAAGAAMDGAAGEASTPLSGPERRARAAALRGLALGRQRRFDAAQAAFASAAQLDPTLDLTRTPGFWKLERAAHEAAIGAYLVAGRERDAVVLRARVRSTYRPKPVRAHREAPAFP